MEWTNTKTVEFIQAIETYPVLWDTTHADYKNRIKKHYASQELAEMFNCDSTEIMRKWKIILAQYRRERKKIADSKCSGSSLTDVHKPRWFGYTHLNFLHGTEEPKASYSTYDDINEQRRAVEDDQRYAHALSMMDNVKTNMDERKQDDDDIFAAAVATKLRKIKNERAKILVQRDIDNLLYDAIIGTGKYTEKLTQDPNSGAVVNF